MDRFVQVQRVNSCPGRFKSWLHRFNDVSRYLPDSPASRHVREQRRIATPRCC